MPPTSCEKTYGPYNHGFTSRLIRIPISISSADSMNQKNQNVVRLNIKVHPHSREQKVEKLDSGVYKIWVQSAPEKGKANKEVLSVLAEFLSLPVSRFKIIQGHRSRHKTIMVEKKPT
jgi:uncharacterized protein (TIGR00251 family)